MKFVEDTGKLKQYFIGSLVFTIIGSFFLNKGFMAWFSTIVFGVFTILSGLKLKTPASLEFKKEGIQVINIGKKFLLKNEDIDGIKILPLTAGRIFKSTLPLCYITLKEGITGYDKGKVSQYFNMMFSSLNDSIGFQGNEIAISNAIDQKEFLKEFKERYPEKKILMVSKGVRIR